MIGRRAFLVSGLATIAAARQLRAQGPGATAPDAHPDRLAGDLLDRARALAHRPYAYRPAPLPPPFDGLGYDSFRGIRPRPGGTGGLPAGPGYSADLLPPGFYYTDPVAIEFERRGEVRRIPFSPGLFAFDPRYFPHEVPASAPAAGFSGLRLRHPINAADRMDEFLVVQGASYFRAIARDLVYGLSARALALGTGEATAEEFPRFTLLRVHVPEDPDTGIAISGLIDSPSAAALLHLHARPGVPTVIRAALALFPRVEIANAGIAPLTSMYFKGPLRAAVADDFRPAVHDSDALRIDNGAGEVLWRPLSNPARVQTSAFADAGPRGFGLVQSRRDFADFEDTEAAYHRRPSAWVVPAQDWGPGAVTLVELPTGNEFMDNIVAFWRPQAPLRPGGDYRFAYDIVWSEAPPAASGLAPVLQTRSGRQHDRPGALRYVVDFVVPADGADLRPDLSVHPAPARVHGLTGFSLRAGARRFRVSFLLEPDQATVAELRLVLRDAFGTPRSMVWLHRWTPARGGRP